MTRPDRATRFEEFDLSAFTFRREPDDGRMSDLRDASRHTHLDLELHVVETGEITLDFSGHEERLRPGQVLAFWGGFPHRDVDPKPPLTVYHVAQIPIVNTLTWANSAKVLSHLLKGELLRSAPSESENIIDRLMFKRWTIDLATDDSALRSAVQMEMEARLLRLAYGTDDDQRAFAHYSGTATTELVGRTIQYITRRFVEPITVRDIATAMDRNHDYLMTSFRQVCGISCWEYVTRLRVSEAQRLLKTTDLTTTSISQRCGFKFRTGLHDAFRKYVGQTPAAYRKAMAGQ